MKFHELKTYDKYFDDIVNGNKTFEVRENDRDFKVGDILILCEYLPVKNVHTGRQVAREIKYILKGGRFGIKKGYVVMGLIG